MSGRTGIITGASSGIGRAVAEALAGAGDRLALVARGEAGLDTVARTTGAVPLSADVTDPDAVAALADRFGVALGAATPDYVVHCAGNFSIAPFAETSPRDFRAMLETNLLGSFLVIRAFLPGMLAAGCGRMVLMGSVAGRRAFRGNAAYAASKYGLRGLFEVLALETADTGVECTLVEPAATATPLWDGVGGGDVPGRDAMLAPADVAEAVSWLLDRPGHVRIPYLSISRSA